jgi:hypothetical protein
MRGAVGPCTASSLGFPRVLEVGARSPGGVPSSSASANEGLLVWIYELVWAWCLWPLCQICVLPPPPNKFRTRSALDLNLKPPAGSSSSPPSSYARGSASPLADHGSEGKGSGAAPAFFSVKLGEDLEDVSLPWCVTSPIRGLVLSAHFVLPMRASGSPARVCAVASSARVLLRVVLLRLSPPARGKCNESNGMLTCFFGAAGVSSGALCALQ